MKKLFLLMTFGFCLNLILAQKLDTIQLEFQPVFENLIFDLVEENEEEESNGKEITNLKFYISNLKFYDDHKLQFECSSKGYLIDASKKNGLKILEVIPQDLNYSSISFNIGIDSTTNVSGVMGGDLDPTTGMYWTWQSGYINFKLEGKNPVCPSRGNKYVFHIGGYQSPYNTLQKVILEPEDRKSISIKVDLDLLFEELDLTENHMIMSPNEKALDFASILPTLFSVQK